MTLLVVMGTGALGASARVLLEHFVATHVGRHFPWGTLVVNVTGSFGLGLIAGTALHGLPHAAVATGFLGAYTTFSAYAYEGVHLAERRRVHAAVTYMVGTVVITSAAAWLGLLIAG